jgi:hypothetical protein
MKTIVKQLTTGIFFTLLLLAGTASADGTEINASSHEISETSLQLEDWMTNENYWNTASAMASYYQVDTENALEVENWMTTESTWEVNSMFAPEAEAALSLEDWMTDTEVWQQNDATEEEALEMESWMTNASVWK